MKVAISCPHCAKRYALAETSLGKSMKCPSCQQAFVAQAEEAGAAAPPAQAKPAPKLAATAATNPLDDDDLFSSAASAPAVKRPAKPAGGESAGKKKGKKGGASGEAKIRIYQQDGQWHAEVPQSLIVKRPGQWMVWGSVAYMILSAILGVCGVPFIDPYGLIAAVVAGASGWIMLSGDYYTVWTDFKERELTVGEAPEPRWLSANLYAVILLAVVSGTIYMGKAFGKPGTPLGPAARAPSHNPAVAAPGSTDKEKAMLRAALADVQSDDPTRAGNGIVALFNVAIPEADRIEVAQALDALLVKPFVIEDHAPGAPVTVPGVLTTMERLRSSETAVILAKRLPTAKPRLRFWVLDFVGRMKDPRTATAVAAAIPADKEQALKALKDMGPAAEEGLIEALKQPDADVRTQVCGMLAEHGTAKAIPALEAETKAHPQNAAARTALDKLRAQK